MEGSGSSPIAVAPNRRAEVGSGAKQRDITGRLTNVIGRLSLRQLISIWFWGIVGFGGVFWVAGFWEGHGLLEGGGPVHTDLHGLWSSVYFSFVTALSIGYGDVLPSHTMRLFAVLEGFAGLLIFGCVISKLVSQRQEELVEETHRIAYEDRLGRVRTNLHLVLSDLQAIGSMCSDPAVRPERVWPRAESAVAVFVGELETVHDLLYRPQQTPAEAVLESILANLAAAMRELHDLIRCLPRAHGAAGAPLSSLGSVTRLASEICGECVPRQYAPDLKKWMDQIQDIARRLA